MSLDFPQLSAGKASTREQIILLLSQEWPLSVKSICNKVGKDSGISYQAVHKIIKQLEQAGTIVQTGRDYKLSNGWISGLRKFSESVGERYSKTQGKYEIKPGFEGKVSMHFDDYSNFIVIMADILERRILVGKGPNIGTGIFRHVMWPLRFSFSDFELFRKMTKSIPETFLLVKHDTPLDKWIKKEWIKGGYGPIMLGVAFEGIDDDFIIHGDSVVQVKYSEDTKKAIDAVYKRCANLTDIFKEYFTGTLSKRKSNIDVTITKNPELAAVMRNQILSHFLEAKSPANSGG